MDATEFLLGEKIIFIPFPSNVCSQENALVTCIQDGRWYSEGVDWKAITMEQLKLCMENE